MTSIGKSAPNISSGVVNLSGGLPLTYSDFAYQLAATMNGNVRLGPEEFARLEYSLLLSSDASMVGHGRHDCSIRRLSEISGLCNK